MKAQIIEAKIKDYLQRANISAPGMSDDIIEEAGEAFKAMLRKTFNEQRGKDFRLYFSNAGKPSCQLVMERDGAKAEPQSYAWRMKMLLGDSMEILLRAIMRASGVKIESHDERVKLPIGNVQLSGRLDLVAEGAVWDIKSASGYSFKNKWASGFAHIEEYDTFGYCAQLYGYAEAKGTKVGGWVVGNKDTGEIAVVPADDSSELRKKHLKRLEDNINIVIDLDRPFERQFQDEPETFHSKPTGNRKLGYVCSMCEYKWSCWPGLTQHTAAKSKARDKKMEYYTQFDPASVDQFKAVNKVVVS